MKPEWVIAYATAVLAAATFILALVAVFQDRIRAALWKPRLAIETTGRPPDSRKLPVTQRTGAGNIPADCYYVRLRVRNDGPVTAEQVEVRVVETHERQPDGTYKRLDDHPSMDLRWSEEMGPPLANLHPHTTRYCDLGHIVKPKEKYPPPDDLAGTELELEVRWPSTTGSHVLSPGHYRLFIQVAAANMRPVTKTLEANLAGPWYDDEDEMLSKGIDTVFV